MVLRHGGYSLALYMEAAIPFELLSIPHSRTRLSTGYEHDELQTMWVLNRFVTAMYVLLFCGS